MEGCETGRNRVSFILWESSVWHREENRLAWDLCEAQWLVRVLLLASRHGQWGCGFKGEGGSLGQLSDVRLGSVQTGRERGRNDREEGPWAILEAG